MIVVRSASDFDDPAITGALPPLPPGPWQPHFACTISAPVALASTVPPPRPRPPGPPPGPPGPPLVPADPGGPPEGGAPPLSDLLHPAAKTRQSVITPARLSAAKFFFTP